MICPNDSVCCDHEPLARYVKIRVAHVPGTPRVMDPDMHHGTCVTHVPLCMSGSIASGFLWSRCREKHSRHSRRMRNPQFSLSGKRPMVELGNADLLNDYALTLILKPSHSGCQSNHRKLSHWGMLYWVDSRFAPSQWETAILRNDVSHWLGANLESAPLCLCYWTGPSLVLEMACLLIHATNQCWVIALLITFRIWIKLRIFTSKMHLNVACKMLANLFRPQ